VIQLGKDKHKLPDDRDTFVDRVEREAKKEKTGSHKRTIYGPDNEVLTRVDVEMGSEITDDRTK
jgi:hypothetical protein